MATMTYHARLHPIRGWRDRRLCAPNSARADADTSSEPTCAGRRNQGSRSFDPLKVAKLDDFDQDAATVLFWLGVEVVRLALDRRHVTFLSAPVSPAAICARLGR